MIDIVVQKDLLNIDVELVAELNEFIGRNKFFKDEIAAVSLFKLFNIFGLALLIRISSVTSGIKVIYKLFVTCLKGSVIRRKIEMEQDFIGRCNTTS